MSSLSHLPMEMQRIGKTSLTALAKENLS